MVNVTDSTDITVRLISNKCFFSHFVISLFLTIIFIFFWAYDRDWTGDLFVTNEVLYLLSYAGNYWASDAIRTRDPQLGRLMLYQLSYTRKSCGQRRIRTSVDLRRQIYSLLPLTTRPFARNPKLNPDSKIKKNFQIPCFLPLKTEPARGFEPPTRWLQISCSTNWATPAMYVYTHA